MKNKLLFRKWLLYGSLPALLLLPYNSFAQSIKRQCISSYGSVSKTDNIVFSQTAGQSFNTASSHSDEVSILYGFQQPTIFKVSDISPDNAISLDLKIFPNPAVCSVTLQSHDNVGNSVIQVNDLSGKLIFGEKITELNNYTINCQNWNNGVYIINVTTEAGIKSALKLIIKK